MVERIQDVLKWAVMKRVESDMYCVWGWLSRTCKSIQLQSETLEWKAQQRKLQRCKHCTFCTKRKARNSHKSQMKGFRDDSVRHVSQDGHRVDFLKNEKVREQRNAGDMMMDRKELWRKIDWFLKARQRFLFGQEGQEDSSDEKMMKHNEEKPQQRFLPQRSLYKSVCKKKYVIWETSCGNFNMKRGNKTTQRQHNWRRVNIKIEDGDQREVKRYRANKTQRNTECNKNHGCPSWLITSMQDISQENKKKNQEGRQFGNWMQDARRTVKQ